jgi:hypothetical protein
METPILDYMRKVLDEHTLPLADRGAGLVDAPWLVDMIHKVEEVYKNDQPR